MRGHATPYTTIVVGLAVGPDSGNVMVDGHTNGRRPANRPAFGGTVPFFYQMSRVLLNRGNAPLFV